jgi:hypothetical protein
VSWVKLSQHLVRCRARRSLSVPLERRVRVASVALACGLLANCGGEPRLAPAADPSPQIITDNATMSTAVPAGTTVATRVGDIVWATATDPTTNAPVEPVSSYPPDALRIVAAVHADAISGGSSVEATWEYNDTSLDAFTTQLTPSERGANQWLSFYIERDPEVEWPVGTYEVKISVNGETVQEAAVEVRQES